jgi:hypothetical protein
MSTTSSTGGGAGGTQGPGRAPSEEELQAAYEAQLARIRIEHLLLDHVVTTVNLGMRRTGLAPGTESERDPEQVRIAVESLRALMPVLEQIAPEQVPQIRDALSQLQLAYVRIGGPPGAGGADPQTPAPPPPAPEPDPPKPGEPGPAQRSGRLWIPGQ